MGEAPPLVTSVGTTLTVKDSTFRGNQVIGTGDYGQGFGGAIHVDVSGIIAVSGSSFLGNTVTATGEATGGAMDLGGIVSGSITGSTFAGNQAAVVTGGKSPSGGSGVGGAISNVSGFLPAVLTISGSTFTNNQARGGPNGGYALGGDSRMGCQKRARTPKPRGPISMIVPTGESTRTCPAWSRRVRSPGAS